MPPDPLRKGTVLMVFVDFLEGSLRASGSIPQAELRVAAGALAEASVLLELPSLVLRAPLPGMGGALLPELNPVLSRAREIRHSTNDSWETPEFAEAVAASGRKQIVFAGIATEVGVGLTALSAVRASYQAVVLADACGTVSAHAETAALHRLAQGGVVLTSWSGFWARFSAATLSPNGPELLRITGRGIPGGHSLQEEHRAG